jgi:hypothetical protein
MCNPDRHNAPAVPPSIWQILVSPRTGVGNENGALRSSAAERQSWQQAAFKPLSRASRARQQVSRGCAESIDGTLVVLNAFVNLNGTTVFRRLIMPRFGLIDLLCVVEACKRDRAVGSFVSMAEGVEELRILTGDFVSTDDVMANALSAVALARGCSVLFDEQAGADLSAHRGE